MSNLRMYWAVVEWRYTTFNGLESKVLMDEYTDIRDAEEYRALSLEMNRKLSPQMIQVIQYQAP